MNPEKAKLIDRLAASVLVTASEERKESDYDAAGVQWLDAHIERLRASRPGELDHAQISELGSFFGKCISASYGGEWAVTDLGLAVRLPDGTTVLPMNRVRQQLVEGETASVHLLFRGLAATVENEDGGEGNPA